MRVKQISMNGIGNRIGKGIGKRLKQFREQMGISQLELSHRSGISQASIARIETHQQRNLKSETIRKLADSLGISVSLFIEEPSIIKEEKPRYVTPPALKMLPVLRWDIFKGMKYKIGVSLQDKADSMEPSLTSDQDAFFIIASSGLISTTMVNEGDLLLIEPNKKYNNGNLVLFLSHEVTILGRIFQDSGMTILLSLSKEAAPYILNKGRIGKPGVKILAPTLNIV